jgi:predicted nucleic acid-binding protein
VELDAELLLVDEKRGRRIAVERGLEVTGLLGVLAEAKARGLIRRCQPMLDEMIRIAGFWIGEDLRTRYLRGLGEMQ